MNSIFICAHTDKLQNTNSFHCSLKGVLSSNHKQFKTHKSIPVHTFTNKIMAFPQTVSRFSRDREWIGRTNFDS